MFRLLQSTFGLGGIEELVEDSIVPCFDIAFPTKLRFVDGEMPCPV